MIAKLEREEKRHKAQNPTRALGKIITLVNVLAARSSGQDLRPETWSCRKICRKEPLIFRFSVPCSYPPPLSACTSLPLQLLAHDEVLINLGIRKAPSRRVVDIVDLVRLG